MLVEVAQKRYGIPDIVQDDKDDKLFLEGQIKKVFKEEVDLVQQEIRDVKGQLKELYVKLRDRQHVVPFLQ